MEKLRVHVQIDETGEGEIYVDEKHADGIWGLSMKDIDMPDGTRKTHMQLFILADIEADAANGPDAPTLQEHWNFRQFGRKADQAGE